MHISRLCLRNFKNIRSLTLSPAPTVNVFWGDNAQGKTNLIEAVYFLSNLRGFRGVKNQDFITHGEPGSKIEAFLEDSAVRHHFEVAFDIHCKNVYLDEKTPASSSFYFSRFQTILFAPEEVNLVKAGPAGRRALMDRAVFIATPSYLDLYSKYRKILGNRNILLKKQSSAAELEPWDEALIRAGSQIRLRRAEFINKIKPYLNDFFSWISSGREKVSIVYPEGAEDLASSEENLRGELTKRRDAELRFGHTLAGPHRDDFIFDLNGFSLRQFGSQGQQRSFMLAFKMAQLKEMEKNLGHSPILLLDDITGELDPERRGFLFDFLLKKQSQIFLTTTDNKNLKKNGFEGARFFRVSGGEFYPDTLE